jgi:hypothetical protein
VLESRRIHRESLVVSAVRMSSGPPERDAHHAGTRPAADEVVRPKATAEQCRRARSARVTTPSCAVPQCESTRIRIVSMGGYSEPLLLAAKGVQPIIDGTVALVDRGRGSSCSTVGVR